MLKRTHLPVSVLQATQERIAWTFDTFKRVCVSFSAGKDSSVMLHLVADEAKRRNRKFGLLLIDLEAQYACTIEHGVECFEKYKDLIEPYWVSIPLILRNASSAYQPRWVCWDPTQKERWVRQAPSFAITDPSKFPFYNSNMEFEEFVDEFGSWYAQGEDTAFLIGIRSQESINRYRTLVMDKTPYAPDKRWTTKKHDHAYNVYPIYDWRTEDIWAYNGKTGAEYNRVYDLMHKAGLSLAQMRICQPYGDDQRKGLWLFHLLEPDTWPKIVARVNGANTGAIYANETAVVLGNRIIKKPTGHTWQSFTTMLLDSSPPATKEHYENKIAVFLKWWENHGYPSGIPDEQDASLESQRKVPSWRRVVKTLLKNDWWCKGLSFGQHKSTAYERYLGVMKAKRAKWQAEKQ